MAKTYTPRSKAPSAHVKFERETAKKVERGQKVKVSDLPRREMVILWHEWKGYHVIPGRTSKYVTMERPGQTRKVFVGKNGGFAMGENISSAVHMNINYDELRKYINQQIRKAKEGK